MKDGKDPTLKTCRTNAMTRIVSDTCWSGVTEFACDCCKSWANVFASKVDIDDNVVDSFNDVISGVCLSDHYVSLMGSNGAAHTLTHWDGSQVKGLGESTKRKGLSK